tara:strand:+ start:188 stop:2467 length:2280 start_codon:yes stop_codon:yes gene_type:complete
MQQQLDSGPGFESEVRRIGRLLWPTPAHQGARIVDGRERDGVIVTDDAIHIIEATTLRTKRKAEDDLDKTSTLVLKLRKENPDKSVRGWFVTKDDLTADQQEIAVKYKTTVNSLPFKDFLGKLVDARQYLSFRQKGSFGSVADPVTNHFSYARDSYVPTTFFSESTLSDLKFGDFVEKSSTTGARTIVLGDFGAGKSMAMRETFFRLAQDFYSGASSRFPIYLNLRNHIGQDSPVEALIRESTNTGYDRYDEIVKAWRADLLVILLDGFDELLTPAWSQKVTQLREHRAACTRLISEFFRESPRDTPIIVAGRFNYFSSNAEMENAFRLQPGHLVYRVNDFTSEQASQLLRKMNVSGVVPHWLPSRPLLLGYIASYAQRQGVDFNIDAVEPAEGWDHLIDRICSREADIQKGLYAEYIRQLLERIGTKARLSSNILSPISQADISEAFREVFDRVPDENSLGMLMRLPGLVAAESKRDDRRFIDADMANICAAGDLYQYVTNAAGTDPQHFYSCRTNIGGLASDFVISKLERDGFTIGVLWAAFETTSRLNAFGTLKGDLLLLLANSDASEKAKWVVVDDALIEQLDLRQSPSAFKKIRLSQSIIGDLEIDEANKDGIPHFSGCLIDTVRGPSSGSDLNLWLGDSSIGQFERYDLTNDAILELDLPKGLKVGLTVLRKLYLQSGGGRKENAFFRGLSSDLRPLIEDVLHTICSHGYATKSNRSASNIYIKSSDMVSDVHAILNKRGAARGDLVEALKKL